MALMIVLESVKRASQVANRNSAETRFNASLRALVVRQLKMVNHNAANHSTAKKSIRPKKRAPRTILFWANLAEIVYPCAGNLDKTASRGYT